MCKKYTKRHLLIDLITDTPNEIITWFNELWSSIYIVEANVLHEFGGEVIYYINVGGENKFVFYQNDMNNIFWCDYEYYWFVLKEKYCLENYEIRIITKLLVEDKIIGNIKTPTCRGNYKLEQIENAIRYYG